MLMREHDKNDCGYHPHKEMYVRWGQETERNLKIIKAFISWGRKLQPKYVKGELQRENKLISYERHSKCWRKISISLESVKPFSSYEALKSGQGITKGESLTSEIFGNLN